MISKTEKQKCVDALKKAITLLSEVNLLLDKLDDNHSKAYQSDLKALTNPNSSKKAKTAKGSDLTQNN